MVRPVPGNGTDRSVIFRYRRFAGLLSRQQSQVGCFKGKRVSRHRVVRLEVAESASGKQAGEFTAGIHADGNTFLLYLSLSDERPVPVQAAGFAVESPLFEDGPVARLEPVFFEETGQSRFDRLRVDQKRCIRFERTPDRFKKFPVAVVIQITEAAPEAERCVELFEPGQVPHVGFAPFEANAESGGLTPGGFNEAGLQIDADHVATGFRQWQSEPSVAARNIQNPVARLQSKNLAYDIGFLPGDIFRLHAGADIVRPRGPKKSVPPGGFRAVVCHMNPSGRGVPRDGIEPPTPAFSGPRSTD